MENQNSQKLNLFWIDTATGKKFPAGVGFHLPEYGEFRLKIDALSDEKQYFAKPVSSSDDRVNYRVEVVIKSKGKFARRSEIGTGYMDSNTGGFILMDVGPFSRCLALEVES
jgi:hypothetical protein